MSFAPRFLGLAISLSFSIRSDMAISAPSEEVERPLRRPALLSIPSLLYAESSGDLRACVGVFKLEGPLPGFRGGIAMENLRRFIVGLVEGGGRSLGKALLVVPGLAVDDMAAWNKPSLDLAWDEVTQNEK